MYVHIDMHYIVHNKGMVYESYTIAREADDIRITKRTIFLDHRAYNVLHYRACNIRIRSREAGRTNSSICYEIQRHYYNIGKPSSNTYRKNGMSIHTRL